MSMMILFIS